MSDSEAGSTETPGALLPVERFLLALAKVQPDGEDRAAAARAVTAPGFSWTEAVALARRGNALSLVARSLAVTGLLEAAPRPEWLDLVAAGGHARRRNGRFERALAPLLARLRREGIRVALMKGAAIVAPLYPPGARVLADVDLLVEARDFARVAAVLSAAGFVQKQMVGSEIWDGHERSFIGSFEGEELAFDLHRRVYPRGKPYRFATEAVLDRARETTFGGAPVLAMSPEDVLVHVATQLTVDLFAMKLGRIADLDALVRSGLDWPAVQRIAREVGASGVLLVALRLARLLGAHPPAATLASLEAGRPGAAVAADLVAGPRLPFDRLGLGWPTRLALRPLLFDRARQQLAYVLSLVVPWRGSAAHLHDDGQPYSLIGPVTLAKAAGAALLLAALVPCRRRGLHRVEARLRRALCPGESST